MDDKPSRAIAVGNHDRIQHGWVATDACTLPTADQPLRTAEFDQLFRESLQTVQRVAATHLQLRLDAAAAATAQDLIGRESNCCAFFDFTITHTSRQTIRMDIAVPAGREDVLDGLAAQAATAQTA